MGLCYDVYSEVFQRVNIGPERFTHEKQAKENQLPRIAVSIVSHRQASLLPPLLADLAAQKGDAELSVFVTLNVPEALSFNPSQIPFAVTIIENASRKGFGANHNAAFAKMARDGDADYFCVVNPDIRIIGQSFFSRLLSSAAGLASCGVVTPVVKNSRMELEDHARKLPTPFVLARKFFGFKEPPTAGEPEWVAGMFMLFPRGVFARLGGFNEKFFLYYEDVDLCCRLRLAGYRIVVAPDAEVIHDARRASHRRPYYFFRHLSSALRFFLSRVYFRCRCLRRTGSTQ